MKKIFALLFIFIFFASCIPKNLSREIWEYDLIKYSEKCKQLFDNKSVEILLFFTLKNHIYVFTSDDIDKVRMNKSSLKIELEKNNETIKDIVFVIHNHLLSKEFSKSNNNFEGDVAFFTYLTYQGFRGLFCLWYNGEIVRIMIENKKQ